MTGNCKIPFLDLVTPHQELEEELVSVFRTALRTAGFIGGSMVENFEQKFAQYCDTKYCIGVGSGTDALRFALIAAGVEQGNTVVTVPNTFIATTEAISQAGARPDFADIDEHTYNMDPEKLREYLETQCHNDGRTGKLINQKTGRSVAAIVPVHLYGQMVDMDPILELAERYNLIVIEDACQAHGVEYFSKKENRWKIAGSMGHAAASAFIREKTWGLVEKQGRLRRMTRRLREEFACCATTASRKSTITKWRVLTVAWTPFRQGSCASSSGIWTSGTSSAESGLRTIVICFRPHRIWLGFLMNHPKAARRFTIST